MDTELKKCEKQFQKRFFKLRNNAVFGKKIWKMLGNIEISIL